MNLLSALGVQHAVLHDDDENKNEHLELNQLISDSKHTDFTISIVTLTKDLETVLGVTPSSCSHRKPQHLLYCYAENRIEEEKLTSFCKKVQSCFYNEAQS
jgi:hypothetical protein